MSIEDTKTLILEVIGKGEIPITIHRAWAPNTFSLIQNSLPIHGRAMKFQGAISIPFDLRAGVENPRRNGERGVFGYDTSGKMILIFLEDTPWDRPFNLLGKLETNLELLETLSLSTAVKIKE